MTDDRDYFMIRIPKPKPPMRLHPDDIAELSQRVRYEGYAVYGKTVYPSGVMIEVINTRTERVVAEYLLDDTAPRVDWEALK